jgi:hypothetical protein
MRCAKAASSGCAASSAAASPPAKQVSVAALRAGHAAGYRRLQPQQALLRGQFRRSRRGAWRGRRQVDEQRARPRRRHHLPLQRQHVVGAADDGGHDVAAACQGRRVVGPGGAGRQQRLRHLGPARPHGQGQPGGQHPLGHRPADAAEADPADARRRRPHVKGSHGQARWRWPDAGATQWPPRNRLCRAAGGAPWGGGAGRRFGAWIISPRSWRHAPGGPICRSRPSGARPAAAACRPACWRPCRTGASSRRRRPAPR